MTYRYHPHARRELDDAADFYDNIDLNLGDDFLEEIDDCVSRVLMFPEAWRKLHWVGEAMQNTPVSLQPHL